MRETLAFNFFSRARYILSSPSHHWLSYSEKRDLRISIYRPLPHNGTNRLAKVLLYLLNKLQHNSNAIKKTQVNPVTYFQEHVERDEIHLTVAWTYTIINSTKGSVKEDGGKLLLFSFTMKRPCKDGHKSVATW